MSTTKEIIKIEDKFGFIWELTLEHKPHLGFSSSFYNDNIIAQVENGKIREPFSDDDHEWDIYYERFAEWADEVKANITPYCVEFFNSINNAT